MYLKSLISYDTILVSLHSLVAQSVEHVAVRERSERKSLLREHEERR